MFDPSILSYGTNLLEQSFRRAPGMTEARKYFELCESRPDYICFCIAIDVRINGNVVSKLYRTNSYFVCKLVTPTEFEEDEG